MNGFTCWFGFGSAVERDSFRALTSIQGVGGRLALAILSVLSPDELARAVAQGDKAMIGRANGVGPNTWSGRVEARAFLGEVVDHVVSVGGAGEIRARCNSKVSIPPQTDVTLTFHEEAFSLIPAGD